MYQLALNYVDAVYASSEKLPQRERLNLSSQIERAATSIVLNIAETVHQIICFPQSASVIDWGPMTGDRTSVPGHQSSVLSPLIHRVFRIVLVPLDDQLVAGLADVLLVEDRAGEDTRHIDLVDKGGIGPVLDFEFSI